MNTIVDYILHLDVHLANLVSQYGLWTYAILAFAIFAETGLVIMPFLPGDSLLFAAGIVATHGVMGINPLTILLIVAAVLGNTVNYWIGKKVGHLTFKNENSLFFKKSYLDKTNAFYEKYGGKTLIIARFIPIVRTYAPFVAGVGKMSFKKFTLYNIIGAAAWVILILYVSFFFGSIPWVKNNFSIVVILIILISITVPIIEYLRNRIKD
ncbi:MAG: hypothetical protein CMF39_05065 [Legionellaceae bacterium]|nr:hypothetical protein [Legionellaceae bacterium]